MKHTKEQLFHEANRFPPEYRAIEEASDFSDDRTGLRFFKGLIIAIMVSLPFYAVIFISLYLS